jgi:hypothetical protein
MSFKSSANANNSNRFLSGAAVNKQQPFAPHRSATGATAANTFSSLNSFISSSHELPPEKPQPPAQSAAPTPYDKNADFPALPSAKTVATATATATVATATATVATATVATATAALSYRCAVAAMDKRQEAEQARIQKEMKRELEAKELAYEELRRDTARSRDVATALAVAANYDISDISESID